MEKRLTKAGLYRLVNEKIISCGLNPYSSSYRVDSIALALDVCIRPEIEYIHFNELKICGVLYKSEKSTSIALNKKRSPKGRNFDCMHELMHYWFHKSNFFYCNDLAVNYYEWQANEGAAQFLMPYQSFIPCYVKTFNRYFGKAAGGNSAAYGLMLAELSEKYNVGKVSVEYRINGLAGEVAQYESGIPLDSLVIASASSRSAPAP